MYVLLILISAHKWKTNIPSLSSNETESGVCKTNISRDWINHKTLPHFHFNENIISFQGGISKLYIRHFAWANGRVAEAGVQGGRRRVERRHPAPPRAPRGIDTSFELVAMETANGAGRRRGFGMVGAHGTPRSPRAASREPRPEPNEKIDTALFGTNPSIKIRRLRWRWINCSGVCS